MFGAFNDGFSLTATFWSATEAYTVDFRYVFNREAGSYEIHRYLPVEDKRDIFPASAGLSVGDLVRSVCKRSDVEIAFDNVSLMCHPVSPAASRHYNVIIRPLAECSNSFFVPLASLNKN